ncbi:MAG: catalase family peroxidase [Dokdonella sp.]|uniref:catalase family peroxidase n=1 Tax=Dokdonella sp. TaxID=2291710 RepID=UPI003266B8EA
MYRQLTVGVLFISVLTLAVSAIGAAAIAGDATQATPAQLVDSLHQAFGNHHVRAVHAKGILLEGEFRPDPSATRLTRSPLFAGPSVPLLARFSDFTGLPDIPDTAPEANPRGFAMKFTLQGGQTMDVVTHSFNGFPVATANDFAELMRAIGASGATATKPTALDAFLDAHPVAKRFLTSQKPAPESYATLSFFGVNSFTFTNADGVHTQVRYRFVPVEGEKYLDAVAIAAKSPNYLMDEVGKRVEQAPVVFDWYAQIASKTDAIADPSIAWPEDRKLVKLGTVTLKRLVSDPDVKDKATMFLPGNVTAGIEPADPMIGARTAAYPISRANRQ